MLLSCKEKQGRQLPEKYLKTDTILDGKVRTFDPYKRLVSIAYYKNGVKDGISVNYHSNGNVYDSTIYKNNLKNGKRFVFDSSGTLRFTDYYFYGHQLGPSEFYDNGKISRFIFSSFEKFKIYSGKYNKEGKIISSEGRLINASLYTTKLEGIPYCGIFCYFINPPNIDLTYQLIFRDTNNILKEILLKTFKDQIFIDSTLPFPQKNYIYSIKGIEQDSLGKERKIFYEDLIYQ